MGYVIKFFAGLPTASGTRWNSSAVADLRMWGASTMEARSSLLANAFNSCWVEALNRRERNEITHFLLLHDDVIPLDQNWLLNLHQEMETVGAKVLSVVLPIKSETGLSSSALESKDHWRPRRLTMTEIMAKPVTWTSPDLLVNSGFLLVDFREPWVEKITWTINDRNHKIDGKWVTDVEPEDWNFSRRCKSLGINVWVTRGIKAIHMGWKSWNNDKIWGVETDPTME